MTDSPVFVHLWNEVRLRWRRAGISSRRPARPDEVEAACRRIGAPLPRYVSEYLLEVGGTAEDEMEELGIRFRPATELHVTTSRTSPDKTFVIFADYLCWSHEYAFEACDPGPVVIVDDSPLLVCDSFIEFWQLYLTDPMRLFPDA